MRIGWGALLAALVVATACGGETAHSSATTTGSPSYIPWAPLARTGKIPQTPSPPATPPVPIPPGTPACNSSQLEAVLYPRGGATGHTNTPLWFRNRSSSECFLEGYADVTILDAQDKVMVAAKGSVQRGTFFDTTDWVEPVLMNVGTPSLQTVVQHQPQPPQGQARLNVEWVDCKLPTAARIAIELPAGSGKLTAAFDVKAGYSPACDSGSGYAPQPIVWRGQFLPTGIQWPPSATYITLQVTINAPAQVKRGSGLVYFVTLRNASDIDYVLNPCPDYNEFLGPKQAVESYGLNCAPAKHVAPGAAVTFEMHMAVPATFPTGATQIFWGAD